MGSMSIWHWLVVLFIVLLLFGRGRIADIMGDMAKGIKSFKKGLADDETAPPPPGQPRIADGAPPPRAAEPVAAPEEARRT